MPRGRSSLCALVVIALFVVPVLSGCSSSENASAGEATSEHSGVISAVVGGLEHGDDEAELKEVVDSETTSAERQELREEAEAGRQPEEASEQGEQASEQESEAGAEPEPAAEREQGEN
jgi:hypothetical protein